MTEPDEMAKIKRALGELCDAVKEEHERGPRHASPAIFKTYSVSDLVNYGDGWTKAQKDTDELLSDPVGRALRKAIRMLGKRLHEIGGDEAMRSVFDDVVPDGVAVGAVDHAWDGIGDWFA